MPTPPPAPTHSAASPRQRAGLPESEILIVGAGPVGLTAAIELARRGVRCRVLDVDGAGPRAAAPGAAARDEDCEPVLLHPRTLESLATLGGGVMAALQQKGRQVRGLRLYSGGHLAGRVTTASVGGPFPFGLTLPLSELGAALRERAAQLAVPIEAAPALAAIEQDGDAVHVLLGPGGAARRLSAAYLLVCDGADSAARRLLGVAVEESRYGERALLAEAPLSFGPGGAAGALGSGADDEILAFFSVQGPLTVTPLLGPGRVRILAPVAPELPPTPAALQALFSARATLGGGGPVAQLGAPTRLRTYPMRRLLAARYRVGRAFLAGEAAHVQSPLSAQGLNLGLQDVVNLSWKLALVVLGLGRPALLDSYEEERRTVAEETVATSDEIGRVFSAFLRLGAEGPEAARARQEIAALLSSEDALREKVGHSLGLAEVHYRGSPIVAEGQGWAFGAAAPAPGERAPDGPLRAAGPGEAAAPGLLSILGSSAHLLLLFLGPPGRAVPDDRRGALALCATLLQRYGARLQCLVVSAEPEPPGPLSPFLLPDAGGALHRRYGADQPSAFLLRPDRHVAYRAHRPSAAALQRYLDGVLTATTAA